MPRESTISYDQIAAAATKMHSQGINPTARAVRELLGNTGSMGTITKHLQQWRDKSTGEAAIGVRVLPMAVQRVLFSYIDEQIKVAHTASSDDMLLRKQECMDVVSENERLHENLSNLQSEFDKLQTEKASLDGRHAQLAEELRAAHAETAAEREKSERSRLDLERALERVEAGKALEREVIQLRDERDAQREARTLAEKHVAVLEVERANLQERLSELKTAAVATADRELAGRTRHGEQGRSRKVGVEDRTQGAAARSAEGGESNTSTLAQPGLGPKDPRQMTLTDADATPSISGDGEHANGR